MAKKSTNDPNQDRLAQVEQSDLGESQLNEEFVDWLKKWGNQILLAILVPAAPNLAGAEPGSCRSDEVRPPFTNHQ